MKVYIPLIIIIITFLLKYIFENNYVMSNSGDAHQHFINKSNVPLIGGF